jgi:hypothetical protein
VLQSVPPRLAPYLLLTLRERGVGARTGSKLDDAIWDIIRELNIAKIDGSIENIDMQLQPDNATSINIKNAIKEKHQMLLS